jgi:hypothetical protein
MTIETKFNIGDYIYFGNEESCNQGYVKDINITFFGGNHIIRYTVDTMFNILPRLITNEKDRYIYFDESVLHSSPNELLQRQIKRYEGKIGHMNDKIEEIKKQIKPL